MEKTIAWTNDKNLAKKRKIQGYKLQSPRNASWPKSELGFEYTVFLLISLVCVLSIFVPCILSILNHN